MALARHLVLTLALSACAGRETVKPSAPVDVPIKGGKPPGFTSDAEKWGKFHSKRFNVSVNLPDGTAWKIDDHREADAVAIHDATSSRLTIRATSEEGLMNRKRCEDRARALGVLPDNADKIFTTVHDEAWIGPEAYDSRVWVAVEGADGKTGNLTGHVFLFGSFIRRCLMVHLVTTVPSSHEEALATRLAVAEEKIVKAISLDAPRTSEDAALPRDKPPTRR